MKRLIRLFCLIAAATALGSCARDKVIPDEELANMKTVGDIFNYLTAHAEA